MAVNEKALTLLRSTVALFPKNWRQASFLGISKEVSQEPLKIRWATLRRPIRVRYFWMKWETYPMKIRYNCYVRCKSARLRGWAVPVSYTHLTLSTIYSV